jgi:hypothetical protein
VFQSPTRIGARSPSGKSKSARLALAAIPLLFAGVAARGAVSVNTGSLGAVANGTDSGTVTYGPGAVTAGGDQAAVYDGVAGTKTTVPFQSGLNPASASPFSVEFWAKPTASDGDDSPVSNRVSAGNRSGWAFFQRDAATGWNFRMYNGAGSAVGVDLTGGVAPLNAYTHVVAVWDGSAAKLYVNGALADDVIDPSGNGVYNASTSAIFTVAATDSGSPYAGSVDEVAFYASALTLAQIQNHFNSISNPTPGAYYSLIQSDGARLQLSNVPEPTGMMMLGAGGLMLLRRRAARRPA